MRMLVELQLNTRFNKVNNGTAHTESVILAVISSLPIEHTVVTARMLLSTGIPYLAYTEETPGFLDLLKFSTYKLIQRNLHEAMAEIKHLKVAQVLLLLIKSDLVDRLPHFHRQLFWKRLVRTRALNVGAYDLNVRNTSQTMEFISLLKADTSIHMIIVWSDYDSRVKIMPRLGEFRDRLWYWYSETSFEHFYNHQIPLYALSTHMFHVNPIFSYQSLNREFTYSNIKRYLSKDTYNSLMDDPWLKYHAFSRRLSPEILTVAFDSKNSLDSEVADSVILPLWWSQPFKTLCSRGYSYSRLLIQNYMQEKVLIVGKNGRRKTYSYTQIPLHYLDSIRKRMSNYTFQRIACKPGYESLMLKNNVSQVETVFTWYCVRCRDSHVKAGDGNQSCETCPGFYLPNQNKTGCYDPYTNVYIDYTWLEMATFATFNVTFVIFSLFSVFCFIKYKRTPVVRAADFPLIVTQALANLLVCVGVPLFFVGRPTHVSCLCRFSVIGFLLLANYSITLTRSQNLLFIFKLNRRVSKNTVTRTRTLAYSMLVSVQLIFALISLFTYWVYPVRVETTLYESTYERQFHCTSRASLNALYLYIMLVVLATFVQCFRARSLPKNLNESKRMLYGALLKFLLIVIHFPIMYGQRTEVNRAFVDMFTFSLLNVFDLILNIGYKVYIIVFCPHRNTLEAFKREIFDSIKNS